MLRRAPTGAFRHSKAPFSAFYRPLTRLGASAAPTPASSTGDPPIRSRMKLRILLLVLVGAAGVGASIALADSGKHGRHAETSTTATTTTGTTTTGTTTTTPSCQRSHVIGTASSPQTFTVTVTKAGEAQLVRAGPGRDRHGRRRGPDRPGQRRGLRHRIDADRPRGRGARLLDEARRRRGRPRRRRPPRRRRGTGTAGTTAITTATTRQASARATARADDGALTAP